VFENLSSLFSALGLGYLVLTAWPLAKTDILPITWLGQLLAGVTGDGFVNMLWALLAGVVTFTLSLLINRLGLLGMGDVKLMSVMALALGWFSPLLPIVALGLSFLLAGVVAILLLVRRKIRLGGSMALGPYLIAGFLGAVTLAVWS